MRVVANIPHHEFSITVFSWNNKYLIKFEKENLEQIYKISEFELIGDDAIQEIINNTTFMESIGRRFEEMQHDIFQALNPDDEDDED